MGRSFSSRSSARTSLVHRGCAGGASVLASRKAVPSGTCSYNHAWQPRTSLSLLNARRWCTLLGGSSVASPHRMLLLHRAYPAPRLCRWGERTREPQGRAKRDMLLQPHVATSNLTLASECAALVHTPWRLVSSLAPPDALVAPSLSYTEAVQVGTREPQGRAKRDMLLQPRVATSNLTLASQCTALVHTPWRLVSSLAPPDALALALLGPHQRSLTPPSK